MKAKVHFWYFLFILVAFPISLFFISCDKEDHDDNNGGPTKVVAVNSPATGKTWMDRNLGASRAATSSTDASSFGGLYQWGRGADGHQRRGSGTTSVRSDDHTPGHGDFIITGFEEPWYHHPMDDDLWQGVNGINNPCPDGYRLPTATELDEEWKSWSTNDAAGAFASPLKWSLAGLRDYSNGSIHLAGSFGYYWSSTMGSPGRYIHTLGFNSIPAEIYELALSNGHSVRCIMD